MDVASKAVSGQIRLLFCCVAGLDRAMQRAVTTRAGGRGVNTENALQPRYPGAGGAAQPIVYREMRMVLAELHLRPFATSRCALHNAMHRLSHLRRTRDQRPARALTHSLLGRVSPAPRYRLPTAPSKRSMLPLLDVQICCSLASKMLAAGRFESCHVGHWPTPTPGQPIGC